MWSRSPAAGRAGRRAPGGRAATLVAAAAAGGLAAAAPAAAAEPAEPLPRLTRLQRQAFAEGQAEFQRAFTPAEGLGPRLNDQSCVGCHNLPTVGGDGVQYRSNLLYGLDLRRALERAGPWEDALRTWIETNNGGSTFWSFPPEGPLYQELLAGGLSGEVIPDHADALSLRKSSDLRGAGLIERIPDALILANERAQREHPRLSGRAVRDADGRVARFGSQLHLPADLRKVVETVFALELGIEADELADLRAPSGRPTRDAVVAFLRYSAPPPSEPSGWRPDGSADPDHPQVVRGRQVFEEIGCADCHRPAYTLPDGTRIQPYSDFLLHDLGPALDDGVALGDAEAGEYRTTPLWGVKDREVRLLHDHRGTTWGKTIQWHGGEAAGARRAWFALAGGDKLALELWLASLRTP